MPREVKSGNCYILQPSERAADYSREQFEPGYWRERPGYTAIDGGRGGSCRIEIDGREAILRRYMRGGFVGKVLSDRYLWFGKALTRPWLEWRILEQARAAGLPVPEPLAACVCRHGLSYRAALITAFLDDTETLTHRLARERLKLSSWQRLGVLVRRLHAAGIRHADLNSDNILIDSRNRFYLIDFDKARVMKRLDDWQWRPLYRLQRSIVKRNQLRHLHYAEDDWQALMDGYQT